MNLRGNLGEAIVFRWNTLSRCDSNLRCDADEVSEARHNRNRAGHGPELGGPEGGGRKDFSTCGTKHEVIHPHAAQ